MKKIKEKIGYWLYPIYLNVRKCKTLYRFLLFLKKTFSSKQYIYCKYSLKTVKELEKENCTFILKEPATYREVYSKRYFGEENQNIDMCLSPEIFLLDVKNAIVLGGIQGIIVDDGYIDDYLKENQQFVAISDSSCIKILDHNVADIMYINGDKAFKEAVSILTPAAASLWHFVTEALGKLSYVVGNPEYAAMPILVDQCVLDNSNLKQLLRYIVGDKTQLIGVNEAEGIKVEHLIYPSGSCWTPMNIKNGYILQKRDALLAKSSLKFVQTTVWKAMKLVQGDESIPKEKVYLSRRKCLNRRLLNEERVELLFMKYGFYVYYPEELSMDKQIELFYQSGVIAGCAGAAFTNLLFCRPKTQVLLIAPRSHPSHMWSNFAGQLELQMNCIDAEVTKKGEVASLDQFSVDLNYLENILKCVN